MAPLRILIADDHATVRQGLKLLIDSQPDMGVVGEAADGKGVLEQADDAEAGHRRDGYLDARHERADRYPDAETRAA